MDDMYYFHFRQRKMKAFPGAGSLCDCCFDQDSGLVSAITHAKHYAAHWEQMQRQNIGLLFWGPPGSGKTFAAACIANALLEKESFSPRVMMATFGTILRQLLAKNPQDKEEYMEQLLGCDLLILDDFGMERQTEYAREQIFSIVDGRYLRGLPLIVTTNLTLQQLKNPESLAEQRIYDRILELCVPVYFGTESLRKQRAADKLRQYKQMLAQTENPDIISA